MKLNLLYLLCLLLSTSAFSQFSISGTITDENNETLIGAAVVTNVANKASSTDFNGNYKITDLTPGTYTLTISYVGYKNQSRQVTIVDSDLIIDFAIGEDAQSLEEVVVVGYGVQRKREVSASIEQVSGAKIMETVTPSFESALQGQAAGVNVIQGSGLAGSGSVEDSRNIFYFCRR